MWLLKIKEELENYIDVCFIDKNNWKLGKLYRCFINMWMFKWGNIVCIKNVG